MIYRIDEIFPLETLFDSFSKKITWNKQIENGCLPISLLTLVWQNGNARAFSIEASNMETYTANAKEIGDPIILDTALARS